MPAAQRQDVAVNDRRDEQPKRRPDDRHDHKHLNHHPHHIEQQRQQAKQQAYQQDRPDDPQCRFFHHLTCIAPLPVKETAMSSSENR